jgi:hypothetical protein
MYDIDPTRIRKSVSNISRLKEGNKERICEIGEMRLPRTPCYPFIHITYDLLRWIYLLNVRGSTLLKDDLPSTRDTSTAAVEAVVT